jgi:hypothetical protein
MPSRRLVGVEANDGCFRSDRPIKFGSDRSGPLVALLEREDIFTTL